MAIWLNYTHLERGKRKILPNYVYALTNTDSVFRDVRYGHWREDEKFEALDKLIRDGALLQILENPESDWLFDDEYVRKILLEAYPYEVEGKFLLEAMYDERSRNERLIGLFNELFKIDYESELDEYQIIHASKEDVLYRCMAARKLEYGDREEAIALFRVYVTAMLRSVGYADEAEALDEYMKKNVVVVSNRSISAVTLELWSVMNVEIGNDMYVVLFHELTHVVNNFFRYHYVPWTYENRHVNYTKVNEGFANLVGYHLVECITNGAPLSEVETQDICYSPFIEAYIRLRREWSSDKEHNKTIIAQTMKELSQEVLSEQKIGFYYDRFYKFFAYDQHQYFYPKELLYHIGYKKVLSLFAAASDKHQYIVQGLLWKLEIE